MWQFQKTDELYHHGVLGMKWGVRRYQNKDGSLTSAGKKRRQMSADEIEVNKLRKKKSYELSNAEIRKVNERKRLEAEYNKLNPGKLAAGAAAVTGAIAVIGKIGGATDSINKIAKVGKNIIWNRKYKQLKLW